MGTLYDKNPNAMIEKTASELSKMKSVDKPDWASFVKTGRFKERSPANENWWHMRAAAVLRKIYMKGPIGVNKLRTLYGGRKNRGHKPEHYYKGSGKLIRVILQQLEKEGLIRQTAKGNHKGRVVTPKGKSFLDKLAKTA